MSREIQRHITGIFDELDKYHATKDFREIHYWSTRNWFKDNEEFQMSFTHMQRLLKTVTRYLNLLSEFSDDLEIKVNKCKQLITLESNKNKKFAVRRNKYTNNKRLGAR